MLEPVSRTCHWEREINLDTVVTSTMLASMLELNVGLVPQVVATPS